MGKKEQLKKMEQFIEIIEEERLQARKELFDEIKRRGYWKEEKTTYVIEEREYPHNELCEGTVCYCFNRAKKKIQERLLANSDKRRFLK